MSHFTKQSVNPVFIFSLSISNLFPLPALLSVIQKEIKSLRIKLISIRTVLAGTSLETQLFSGVSTLKTDVLVLSACFKCASFMLICFPV